MARGSSKQKAWRRTANAVKATMIAEGKHEPGMRWGRAIKATFTKLVGMPSPLLQGMMIRAGLMQAD
jgi:hypothetical protein